MQTFIHVLFALFVVSSLVGIPVAVMAYERCREPEFAFSRIGAFIMAVACWLSVAAFLWPAITILTLACMAVTISELADAGR